MKDNNNQLYTDNPVIVKASSSVIKHENNKSKPARGCLKGIVNLDDFPFTVIKEQPTLDKHKDSLF